jgi:hypothetical protein
VLQMTIPARKRLKLTSHASLDWSAARVTPALGLLALMSSDGTRLSSDVSGEEFVAVVVLVVLDPVRGLTVLPSTALRPGN